MHIPSILIYVLCDSITNSIFEGQIIQPLLMHKKNNYQKIIIISFERNLTDPFLEQTKKKYSEFNFVFIKNYPYSTPLFLWPLIKKLHKQLRNYESYDLIARGPVAGYLAINACTKDVCKSITIQARGALAEEYNYAHNEHKGLLKLIHELRFKQFQKLESLVYRKQRRSIPLSIEVVSLALKDYLITTYHADNSIITLAAADIPAIIPATSLQNWRKEIRDALKIDSSWYVYCYNGSIRPWQCPKETIKFFKELLQENKTLFLLVLTQDKDKFEHLLTNAQIPPHHYNVLSVEHRQMYRYLAACDAGIIFREPSIINWVSRPTKVLEYQAVGLRIIHNNTIGLLSTKTA